MKKNILSALILGLAALLCGCSSKASLSTDDSSTQSDTNITYDSVEISTDPLVNSISVTDMIAESTPEQNLMFSPTSLNFALGILSEGAEGGSKELLSTYLGDSFSDHASLLLSRLENLNSSYTDNGYSEKLKIEDAVWFDKSLTLNDSFIESAQNLYEAKLDSLDFSDTEESAKTINKWVDDSTEGLIDSIVTPDNLLGSKMCITNTVYFEAPWLDSWTLNDNTENFTNSTGQEESINYVETQANVYYENNYATAFGSYYSNGIQFIGILPKQEGSFELSDLDIPGLLDSVSEADEINAKMPCLNFDTSASLVPILSAFGMSDLFTSNADFSGISQDELFVSSILQKTHLELDENGTKAAAVTSLMMLGSSAPTDNPVVKNVFLTRPFAFVIYDSDADEVLFIGKVCTTQQN